MRWFLRSKIHTATVTEAKVEYVGSVGIDAELVEKAGLLAGEKVLIVDNTNGARVETYVILEEPGSGVICVRGAAARLIKGGDQVIVMGFELAAHPVEVKNVLVDQENRFVRYL